VNSKCETDIPYLGRYGISSFSKKETRSAKAVSPYIIKPHSEDTP
jgi:hypothetical protein